MSRCSTLGVAGGTLSCLQRQPAHSRRSCGPPGLQFTDRRWRSCSHAWSLHHGLRDSRHSHLPHVNPFEAAWGTSINIDAQSVAAQLFASSIIPYAAFLFFLTRSKKTPGMALFGFYFLLVFVFATIPAGIYAKTRYGTILANVDYLHGSAESLLTITNLLIVLGVRQGIREAEKEKAQNGEAIMPSKELQREKQP